MADQAINALSTKTAPETSDQLLLVGTGEPQLIDYDKMADAILNKITSKNYALDAGRMTLLAALNKLNSDTFRAFNLTSCDAISTDLKSFNYGIARYAHIANDAPSDDNGFLISLYRSENARTQIALSDLGNLYVRTANSAESFNEWIVYNKI